MPDSLFFTINLLIRSETNLKKSIDNIIGDVRFFRENIQLILIDSVGSEATMEICAKYNTAYPDNVYFVDAVDKNPAECYNHARPIATGKYISFIDNYGGYEKDTLKTAREILSSGKIPAFCMQGVILGEGAEEFYADDISDGVIDLHETPDKLVLMCSCWFFRSRERAKLHFDSSLQFHYGEKFVIDAMHLSYSYVYSGACAYFTITPSERSGNHYTSQYLPEFYTPAVRDFIIPMLRSYAGSFLVQSAMMYLLCIKLAAGADDRWCGVLSEKETDEFFTTLSKALGYIDDTVIINRRLYRLSGLDEELPFRLLRLRYNNPKMKCSVDVMPPKHIAEFKYYTAPNRMEAIPMSGEFAAHVNKTLIARSKDIRAQIKAINADNSGIYIDAVLSGISCLDEHEYSVYVLINGTRTPVIPSRVFTQKKLFGRPFLRKYSFRFFAPVTKGKTMDTISLYFRTGKLAFRIGMTFDGISSRLSENIKGSSAVFGKKVLAYDSKTRCLTVRRATESLIAFNDSRLLSDAVKRSGLGQQLNLRRIIHSAKALKKDKDNRKIIFFCSSGEANTNTGFLFRYFLQQKNSSLELFFCAPKGSTEMLRLEDKGYEGIVEAGSIKAKAAALAADGIITSCADPYTMIGMSREEQLYLRGFAGAMITQVNDYPLTGRCAERFSRLSDNTQLLFVASPDEKKNLLSPSYDYIDSMIKTTGYPCLDALGDKKEKLIVVAPAEHKQYKLFEGNESISFADSDFFRIYSSVVTDTSLRRACRNHSWKIALMLPESLQKYSQTFSPGEILMTFSPSRLNATALVSKGAVLVTDSSELQYSFACLCKPSYYFHHERLPDDKDAYGKNVRPDCFGPSFTETDKLIEALKEGIISGFTPDESFFIRRARFFPYTDKRSCERIYDILIHTL